MNRIQKLFLDKSHNILSVFYTGGFPELHATEGIAKALENAGTDIIEIGIPFSDPVADGPTIQESNKLALDNGMNLKLLLQQVSSIRKTVNLPIILMGYLNPVMQYGIEKFVEDAAAAGVDGLILPDMPMDVYQEEYSALFATHGLSNTFLISPTTSEERIRKIDAVTEGFIYAVSASSTTGAKGVFTDDQLEYFKKLKNMKLKNPFLIGFGISDRKAFATACEYCSGAIVGSAFINLIRDAGPLDEEIGNFVRKIKGEV